MTGYYVHLWNIVKGQGEEQGIIICSVGSNAERDRECVMC